MPRELLAVHHMRDGTVVLAFSDGRAVTADLGHPVFEPTSMLDSSTFLPQVFRLVLRTTRGDEIVLELPRPTDLAPLRGRPTIYLDQNHWSTLAKTIHDPTRVRNEDERRASQRLIDLARAHEVVLPMSAAHMAETSKQNDLEQRYGRALTIAQLSAGWRLRDPLSLRQLELQQILTWQYRGESLAVPAAVTLEPDVVHEARGLAIPPVSPDLSPEMQWSVRSQTSVLADIDAMLDTEPCPMDGVAGWVTGFQDFATFLRDNPAGPEIRRQRTHLRFVADLGKELAEAAWLTGVTRPEDLSDWLTNRSEADIRELPALGLFREVLHEKLSDPNLRWTENDLTDMIYLTAAAGYCDHIVGERTHMSHIANSARRLGRTINLHRTLRSLVEQL
ncbi:hypothetical protein ACIRG5_47955 [Lentzea sp. NPDC102401]|uniref:hypothetical protein n=1 Tax=Lentzea sp. NPDC102401 TaxID=3364128 RepID=UPI00382DC759